MGLNMSLLQEPDTRYELIIFDFDGTLADSSEGILDAHKYTIEKFGLAKLTNKELRNFIGGNLLKIYLNEFDLSTEVAKEAVSTYRKRYSKVGIKKAELYPGCTAMLKNLKEKGYKLAIATLKADSFVKRMVENMEISEYFDCVCGMTNNDNLTKAELIQMCMHNLKANPTKTVFVGDSLGDYEGAINAKVEFIGVTYGFGFKKEVENSFRTVQDISELLRVIETNY